jgi:hypothetical protein
MWVLDTVPFRFSWFGLVLQFCSTGARLYAVQSTIARVLFSPTVTCQGYEVELSRPVFVRRQDEPMEARLDGRK